MTQQAQTLYAKAKEQVMLRWLVGLWMIFFTVGGLSSCILGCLIGADWKMMDAQGKFMIVLAVIGNWSLIMMAFFSKAAQRVQSGQLPIEPDDGQIITSSTQVKTQLDVQKTQAQSPNP